MKQDMSVLVSSNEEAWITNPMIIHKITNVLEGIELDPASSIEANKFIKADRIFTIADDMLTKTLESRSLFLNPPFGKVKNKSKAGIFCNYVVEEFEKSHIKDGAIILVHTRTGYDWYNNLTNNLISIELRDRIRFINPTTLKEAPQAKTSQTLFLLGDKYIDNFISEFKDFGYFRYHSKLKGKVF